MNDEEILKALEGAGCDIRETLDETFMGNVALYRRMLGKFAVSEIPAQLRAGFEAASVPTVFELAHELKGVCANLGLAPLAALASEITETARAGRLDGVGECLDAFEKARARILAALEERP